MLDLEYDFLAELSFKRNTKICMDIGTFCGQSAIALLNGNNDIYTCDPHKNYHSLKRFRERLESLPKDQRDHIIPFIATSKETFDFFGKNHKFDLILIDGSHKKEDVLLDFTLWFPRLRNGGIIIFHDSFYWEVNQVLKEILLANDSHIKLIKIFHNLTVFEKTANNLYENGYFYFDLYSYYKIFRGFVGKIIKS